MQVFAEARRHLFGAWGAADGDASVEKMVQHGNCHCLATGFPAILIGIPGQACLYSHQAGRQNSFLQ
jgi:hypothetical protein